ncbi:MAG: ribonuclease HIII [Solirubrobacterales bacterium]
MKAEERRLEKEEESYWTAGGEDLDLARKVVQYALAAQPRQPATLFRALQIARRAAPPPPLAARIESDLETPAKRLRELLALLDLLGDENLPAAEAVFDHLVPAVGELKLSDSDLAGLGQRRERASNRVEAAAALLETIGWERVPDPWQVELRDLLESLRNAAAEHQARALVVSGGEGLVLGLNVFHHDGAGVEAISLSDPAMETQGRVVLSRHAAERGVGWKLEWPLTYEGTSLGLALALAALTAFENLPNDPLLAASGEVDQSGAVRWVAGIEAKLRAACKGGFRRLLLPAANREEVEALGLQEAPTLIYVSNVKEIRPRLAEAGAPSDFSLGGRTRFLMAAMSAAGLDVYGERDIEHGRQFRVADGAGDASVQVYDGARSNANAGGAANSARALAEEVIARLYGGESDQKRESRKWKLVAERRRESLREALEVAGADPRPAKGASEQWRFTLQRPGSRAQVTLWRTGTLMLQGEGGAFDHLAELIAAEVADLANAQGVSLAGSGGVDDVLAELPRDVPWAGTDESGKGDYFGPLVSAAVLVDAEIAAQLEALGVQDSKKLTDRRVNDLAPKLRRLLAGRFHLTSISPPTYNKLHTEMRAEKKNLNTLLAWGHARSIEDLLGKGRRPDYVIIDKFADASYIERKLLADTRESGIRIIQVTKAEADLAVAAASILAREAFLAWLARKSAELGFTLPKGASPQVIETGRRIIAELGESALGDYAKLSFKTTKKVLAA